jgi:hypothetical protein
MGLCFMFLSSIFLSAVLVPLRLCRAGEVAFPRPPKDISLFLKDSGGSYEYVPVQTNTNKTKRIAATIMKPSLLSTLTAAIPRARVWLASSLLLVTALAQGQAPRPFS